MYTHKYRYFYDIIDDMSERRKRRNARMAIYSVLMTCASIILLIVALFCVRRDLKTVEEFNEVNSILETVSADFKKLEDENTALIGKNERLTAKNKLLSETSTGAKFREKLKSMMQSGSSTTQMLKYFFPDELIYTDQGSFYFAEINEELKMNGRKAENYTLNDNGEVEYAEDGEKKSFKGIDVSKHNGDIDWKSVSAAGVEFAYIRCGIRGYGSGKIEPDVNFEKNLEGARNAGIKAGVYFFSQAINEAEAEEEADTVLALLDGLQTDLPVAIDIEKIEGTSSTPRTSGLSQEEYTSIALKFCEKISANGYEPMIYGNIKTFLMMLDMSRLENIEKWFAGYISDDNYTPYFPYKFRIWQYRSKGKVDGINGDVDMNIAFY